MLKRLQQVENSGFRNFTMKLHPLYKVPSRKKITYEILPTVFQESKVELLEKLKNVKYVALTTDIWTSDNTM